jgi:polyhydroxybutyrate depolymerase
MLQEDAAMGIQRTLCLALALTVTGSCRSCRDPESREALRGVHHESERTAPRLGGDRPAAVTLPPGGGVGLLPLVLLLHGYGDEGESFAHTMGYGGLSRRQRFLLLAPDGTLDREGRRFWNATDACCNFYGSPIDDVRYLKALIRETRNRYRVDPRRIYLVGLSNGAFMAHRLACEDSEEIAAVISIAGALGQGRPRCRPATPVSILQVHGDRDQVILYDGGDSVLGLGSRPYPGAAATVGAWGDLDGCSPLRAAGAALDLELGIPGAETQVEYRKGCPAGIDVRLWTIQGGAHVPNVSASFIQLSWEWLEGHPKPASR